MTFTKGAMLSIVMILAGCAEQPSSSTPQDSPTQASDRSPVSDQKLARARALQTAPKIVASFEHFGANSERTNQTMVQLTQIPAPPFQESARAQALMDRLIALGLDDVSIDSVGNVIAVRPGIAPDGKVAVVAHVDTVFPPQTDVTVRKEGNTFYAPGIADNTRGLAVMLAVIEAMQIHDIQTKDDVVFVGSVGEEGLGDLRGVRHLLRGDHGFSSFIAVDGGKPNRLVTSAVGSHRYRVTFEGPGGHSYGAFGRAHPHQALALAITEFTARAEPIVTQAGPKATFSVGRIGGGTSINSIPFESWMEVDMRSVDPVRLEALDAAFRAALEQALEVENQRRSEDEAMTLKIEDVGKRPAGQGRPDSDLVLNALSAMRALGLTPELRASSTDANIPIWLGIPAVTISRGGDSENAHTLDEAWTDDGTQTGEKLLLLTLLLDAGFAPSAEVRSE